MVVDTSALIAVLFGEPEEETFLRILLRASGHSRISAASVLETQIVARRRYNVSADKALDGLLYRLNLAVEPVTLDQLEAAREGYRRFGHGTGGGVLNLGDCFSYALAKVRSEPILFKGSDFGQTDIEAVAWALPPTG
jgi:ribonuclease VapC